MRLINFSKGDADATIRCQLCGSTARLTGSEMAALGHAILQEPVMPILRALKGNGTFEPEAITVMTEALERVCTSLQINGQESDREVLAKRIIDLARGGDIDAMALADRVIAEAKTRRAL